MSVVWVKDAYFQDDQGLWYRPGFDPATGARHLLVSGVREGLDRTSVSAGGLTQFSHLHFWQIAIGDLGFNVMYLDQDSSNAYSNQKRIKKHVYAPNTLYKQFIPQEQAGAIESIFFSQQMKKTIQRAMTNTVWFSDKVFVQAGLAFGKGKDLSLTSSTNVRERQGEPMEFRPISLRHGTEFEADSQAMQEFLDQLNGYAVYLETMIEEVQHMMSQAGQVWDDQVYEHYNAKWMQIKIKLEDFSEQLQPTREYLERKIQETQQIGN